MIIWLVSFLWFKTEKGFQNLLNWDSNTITYVKVSMCIFGFVFVKARHARFFSYGINCCGYKVFFFDMGPSMKYFRTKS